MRERAGRRGCFSSINYRSCFRPRPRFTAKEETRTMSRQYLLAIDQGTTSTRAVVYDDQGQARGSGGSELTQHYPRPGWVEHDPEEIWASTLEVVPRALAEAGIDGAKLAAIGVTNQRETALLWDRATSRPTGRAIVWQDRRTSDF